MTVAKRGLERIERRESLGGGLRVVERLAAKLAVDADASLVDRPRRALSLEETGDLLTPELDRVRRLSCIMDAPSAGCHPGGVMWVNGPVIVTGPVR